MTRAADVLSAIAEKAVGELPRYQSGRSGEAFDRLTADSNLDLFRNRSLPIELRLSGLSDYMRSSNRILKLYLAAFNQRAVGGSEFVELAGAALRISVIQFELLNEVLPTMDKDDPTYPVRMYGVKRMRRGVAEVAAGSLQTLTESHAYRTSELKRLVRYMRDTFPYILPELPSGSRHELLLRLRAFSDDPRMQNLKPELDALVATAEKSVQTDKAP